MVGIRRVAVTDRMSPLDAGFWELEDRHASLHVASVTLFAGPAPTQPEILALYSSAVESVPRLRQKMRTVPLGLARPVWVDDPDFELTHHVHRMTLPAPASHATPPAPASHDQLCHAVEELMSTSLERDRPLWHAWVIDGLEGDHWALVSKLHHSMVDGIAGIGVLSKLLDTSPDPIRPVEQGWTVAAQPSTAALIASALVDQVHVAGAGALGLAALARHPVRKGRPATEALRGAVGYAGALRPVSATSLIGPIGSGRRYRTASAEFADVARVRKAFGGSMNDVVLTLVTRAFRDLLLSRGEAADPHAVRCLVPVSVRTSDGHDHVDNQVSALLVDLPIEFADPLDRLHALIARMRQLKSSHEADGGQLMTQLAGYVAAPALTAALHAAFRFPQQSLTTVATNVPGPRQPLYALGRRMLANYPYVPIANRVRIGVAITSYDGRLFFGVTADRDSVPDVDLFTASIEDGLTELVKLADGI